MTRSPPELRPNQSSGIPIFLLGLIAVGAGIRHESAACLALGVALVAAPVAVLGLLWLSMRGLRLRRILAETAFEGDAVDVRFVLVNRSRLSLFYPVVGEVFTPEVHEQKTVVFPHRVLAGEAAVAGYRGTCVLPRGIYAVGPAWVSVSDPLGWFQLRRRASPLASIKVYPRFQPFGVREDLGVSLTLELREVPRFGIGDSNEFFSVREYRPGDPLRRVHWALTAHRGYPVVREYTRTAVGDLCLFLDLYRYALLGVGRGSSLEHAVKIAASLSSHALRRGHRVQLHAWGRAETHVPVGRSAAHLKGILDALVEVRPDGDSSLEDLLDRRNRAVEAGATAVIMVSPYLHASARFEGQLIALHRRGARVVLVVFDGSTFRSLYDDRDSGSSAEEFATRMRIRGLEAHVVPCAANLQAVFAGAASASPSAEPERGGGLP